MDLPTRKDTKIIKKPNYTLAIFLGGVTYLWTSQLLRDSGYESSALLAIVLASACSLLMVMAGMLVDAALSRAGVQRSTRFGMWTGAIFGPYMAMAAFAGVQNPITSHMLGVVATVAMFAGGYIIDKLVDSQFWLKL